MHQIDFSPYNNNVGAKIGAKMSSFNCEIKKPIRQSRKDQRRHEGQESKLPDKLLRLNHNKIVILYTLFAHMTYLAVLFSIKVKEGDKEY